MTTWHAPGMGEVHSEDDKIIIGCDKEDENGDLLACDETARMVCDRLNALTWRKTSEEIPEDGQFVNFVVYYPPYSDGTPRRQGHLHGKVFGGEFSKAMHEAMGGGFSTPGQGYFANYWMPVPEFKEDQ